MVTPARCYPTSPATKPPRANSLADGGPSIGALDLALDLRADDGARSSADSAPACSSSEVAVTGAVPSDVEADDAIAAVIGAAVLRSRGHHFSPRWCLGKKSADRGASPARCRRAPRMIGCIAALVRRGDSRMTGKAHGRTRRTCGYEIRRTDLRRRAR